MVKKNGSDNMINKEIKKLRDILNKKREKINYLESCLKYLSWFFVKIKGRGLW